jgi:hypothetical protein
MKIFVEYSEAALYQDILSIHMVLQEFCHAKSTELLCWNHLIKTKKLTKLNVLDYRQNQYTGMVPLFINTVCLTAEFCIARSRI